MKGIVESIYIEIGSDISVIGVVMVETPVGIYLIVVSSAMNLRATSLYIGKVKFLELNREVS